MTESEANAAHDCWLELWVTLRSQAFAAMDKFKLNEEQREYVENKLHEELRFWK